MAGKRTWIWAVVAVTVAAWIAPRSGRADEAPAVSEADEALRAERDRLNSEMFRLYGERDWAGAIVAAQQMLEFERRWLGNDHTDVLGSLQWLALLATSAEDWPAAEAWRAEAVAWTERVFGADDWRSIDARRAFNQLRFQQSLSAEARADAIEAMRSYKASLAHSRAGEYEPARELAERAEILERKVFAPENPYSVAETPPPPGGADPLTAELLLAPQQTAREPHVVSFLTESFDAAVIERGHIDYADALAQLGSVNRRLGDMVSAEAYARRAMAIRKAVLGEMHPDYAASLNFLAVVFDDRGQEAEAEPLYRQACDIAKATLGEHDEYYLTYLANLATLYQEMRDYSQSALLWEEVLAIRKETLGETHPDYIDALFRLGSLKRSEDDLVGAETLYRQALELRRATVGEDHVEYARAAKELGSVLLMLGRIAQAEPLLRQAAEIYHSPTSEIQSADYANCLMRLSRVYAYMGDWPRVEKHLTQYLETAKPLWGETSLDYAVGLYELAQCYNSLGDDARAEAMHREALAIVEASADHSGGLVHASILGALSRFLADDGDMAGAVLLTQQSYNIYRLALPAGDPALARGAFELASMYRLSGEFALAEPLYLESLEMLRTSVGERHPNYSVTLTGAALLYESMGDDAKADAMYRQTVDIAFQNAEEAAVVQDEQGQRLQLTQVRQTLDGYLSFVVRQNRPSGEAYDAVLRWKGVTLARQRAARLAADRPELAQRFAELRSVVREWATMTAARQSGDEQWSARLAELTDRKRQLEAEVTHLGAAGEEIDRATLADVLAALDDRTALVDFLEIEYLSKTWEKYVAPEIAPDQYLGQFYEQVSSERKPWEGDVRGRLLLAFIVRPGQEVQLIDLNDTDQIAALVDQWRASYGASAEGLAAGLALREKLWQPVEAALGDATTVLISPDGALGKLPFAALPGRAPDTFLLEDYRLALVPVPRLIPTLGRGDAAEQLPNELLLVGGVDYDHRDIAGAVDALAADESAGEEPPIDLVAVAQQRGFIRQATGGTQWPALSGAAREVDSIAAQFEQLGLLSADAVVRLSAAAATEENFRAAAPLCRILHVATHGYFAAEEPDAAAATPDAATTVAPAATEDRGSVELASGLVLAGANSPPELPDDPAEFANLPDDGLLTAGELAFLPLGGVQLVVLSACETGLGEIAGGEGLLGIQRAFQIAGARTTIATLWKVDDAMTQRLMTNFYRNVLEGKQSYLDALRNAQLEMLNEVRTRAHSDAEFRGAEAPDAPAGSPYYWAAFTLSGDWR